MKYASSRQMESNFFREKTNFLVANDIARESNKKTKHYKEQQMEISEQEFARLIKAHKSIIYTVCYMFSNEEDEVADLFQEVMIKVWRGLPSFNEKSDIKTWIYRIALNTCISIDKKKKNRKEAKLSMDINLFSDSDKETEQVNILHKRISRLMPLDRAIVLLWLENISYDEIGAIIGISAKNVSVRLVRIREQLKAMSNE